MLVDDDGPRREALRSDLSRRYEADYEVVGVASAGSALAMLSELACSEPEYLVSGHNRP